MPKTSSQQSLSQFGSMFPNLTSVPKMKNHASSFVKQMFATIATIVKAKSTAVRSKASAIKTRLLIFGLLRNKKLLMSTISHKIHALTGTNKGSSYTDNFNKAIVLYNSAWRHEASPHCPMRTETITDDDDDDEYPDLKHSLFDIDDDDEEDDGKGSVIEMVRNSREGDRAEFSLEAEIDHVADVFIRRFHRQMKMQRIDSLKMYQEMLERSV